jgi:hypothetical protein
MFLRSFSICALDLGELSNSWNIKWGIAAHIIRQAIDILFSFEPRPTLLTPKGAIETREALVGLDIEHRIDSLKEFFLFYCFSRIIRIRAAYTSGG